ncbi:MAG TPA: glycosyltransferase family 2 protein [Candidatus Angelobacter sp.]|nr:glycosyltransferase family 2 protein [Candidatus Angelobacter sp.]
MASANLSTPLFSIIVPNYNEELLLPKLLESVRQQTLQDYEVIVADDSSTDLTQEIADHYGARLLVGKSWGEYPSRNAGASIAKGSILIFTGADTLMPPNLLSRVAKKFEKDHKLAGTYCPTYPYDGALWAKVEFTFWYVLTTLLFWVTREANASTAFFAVRAEVFRETGGFRNTAHADSALSRQLAKNFKIRPDLHLLIFVSGRRTRVGMGAFNRYHLAMIIDVVFGFLRKSGWLLAEKKYRIGLHTRSNQASDQGGPAS